MAQKTLDQLIATLFATHRIIHEQTRSSVRIDPATLVQLQALHYISGAKSPTMREVARHLHITPPSATSLINTLVRTGLSARAPDSKDRRVIRLAVTPKGERAMARGFEKMKGGMRRVFSRLNEDEQRRLIQILEKILHTYQHEK